MAHQENQEVVTIQVHQVFSSLDPIQEIGHQVMNGYSTQFPIIVGKYYKFKRKWTRKAK